MKLSGPFTAGLVAALFLILTSAGVGAWSRAYIGVLPDEAFAVVEEQPDGRRARHLPHHDADGRVDPAHLRSALSRLRQVRWVDAANAERARHHLLEHSRELGRPVHAYRSRPPGRRDRSDARGS